ncbi:MAG TPA: T9SS type A sorting domain-containing protein [Chitinispirillaceae bacterium]|nr:T9SS type A sorting domain-containing protein [Chitinispirillaceae bacterium]
MLRKHSRSVVAAGVSLLMAVSFGFADFLLDDFNDMDNKNEIGSYWYFYNDNDPGGTSVVNNDPFEDAGVNEDGVAYMDFTLGDSVPKNGYPDSEDGYMLYPFVGIGFNFIGNGKTPYDLTGATAISFDIWADKKMDVKFILETEDVKNDNKLRCVLQDVGTTREKRTVLLEIDKTLKNALSQEADWGTPHLKTYDPTKNLKVAFQVRGNENPTLINKSGKLFIDNFNIVGSPKIRRWGELDTVSLGTYKSDLGLLSDFSSETPTINNLKGEWFIYNDADNTGTSKFTKGYDPEDDKKFIVDETGGANGTVGVSMAFELGPKLVTSAGDSIVPYVGVGCNIVKGGKRGYDAKTDGATGLYLEYKSTIYVNVEVEDSINRGSGVVYYAALPPTGTNWAGVKIPFDSLKLPQWYTDAAPRLTTTGLRKIQFKLSDGAIKEGIFAIDNIYFMGAKFSSGIIARSHKLIKNNIDINQSGNVINVRFNGKSALEAGSVSLLNTMGKVVASKSINKEVNTCTLPLGNNASGVYLLRVTSENGLVETLPVHLFR